MTARRALLYAVLLLSIAGNAFAVDYYAAVAGGDWTTNTTWHIGSSNGPTPQTGAYPGSAAGDRAFLNFQGIAVTVSTVVPNAVELQAGCVSCSVTVASGGVLPLSGASSVSSGTVLNLSGGTINNSGTLSVTSGSSVTWTGGTLTGSGTTAIASGASVTAQGPSDMILSGQFLDLSGTLSYTGGQLRVNSAARIAIRSGGVFDIQIINGITTDDVVNTRITVDSGGTFKKTGGNYGTNIDPPLYNDGMVQVDVGTLVFGRGVYTGTFNMNGVATAVAFAYPGTHQFTGTTGAVQGTGEAFFGGAVNLAAGADLDVTRMQNDSFAPFSGSGTMNISGSWSWRGASVSGITVNLLNGSVLNVTAEGNATLTTNAHIVNGGTINVNAGAGSLAISSGARITNNNTLNLNGDVTINSNGLSNARIDNGSTIAKTTGAGTATIHPQLNNSGTVTITSGSLELKGGGTHAGGFTVNGAWLAFSTATHTLSGATVSGTGLTKLLSGTLDIAGNGASISTPFAQSGGTVSGASNLFLTGGWTWSGGTHAGTGTTFVNTTGASFTASSLGIVIDGRQITNNSTITYAPAGANLLSINNGGKIANAGTFLIAGDHNILSNGGGSLIDNRNALTKSAGSGTAQIFAAVDNSSAGVITVSAGTLALNGGGTSTTSFVLGANTLAFEANTYNFNSGTTITGSGTLRVAGATLVLNTPVTTQNATLASGTITGGDLTVNDTFTWTGGTMTGPGSTIVATTLTLTGATAARTLDGRVLTIAGAVATYAAGSFPVSLNNSSRIDISGTLYVGDGDILTNGTGTNVINNYGTLMKSSGSAGARIDVPVHSNSAGGSLHSATGTLILAAGGSLAGGAKIHADSGALVDVFGGTFTISAGSMTGAGKFRVTGSTAVVAINTNFNATNVEVNNGTWQVAGSTTTQATDFDFHGGTLSGSGTTRTFNGHIGNAASPTIAAGHTLTNAGTTQIDGNLLVNGTLNNESGSTLDFITDRTISGSGTFTSMGTITKSGGAGVATISMSVSSTGTSIGAASGTLRLTGGGTISSAIHAGSTFEFGGGTFTVTSTSVTGSGTLAVTAGTVNFNANVTIPTLLLSGGVLSGSGAVTANNGTWSGGDMTGSGSTIIASGATFNITNSLTKALSRTFTNNGTMNHTAASVAIGAGITFTNAGALHLGNLQNDVPFSSGGAGALLINGAGATLTRNGSTTARIEPPVQNDGTISVVAGTLGLAGAGTHTGTFNVSGGASLFFSASQTLSGTSSVSSTGAVELYSGTSTFGGSVSSTTFRIQSGPATTAIFNGSSAATFGTLTSVGTIGGTAAVDVTTQFVWIGGTVSGSAPFTVAGGVILPTAGATFLDGRTLVNNGTFTYSPSANALTLSNGAAITNNGTFTIDTDTAINAGAGGGSFTNAGTFQKNTATGTTTFAPSFTTSSLAKFWTGTVNFAGGYTQTAGQTALMGGSIASPFAVNINGGTLTGNGTINAAVNNAGILAPGSSAGTITINGTYTQTGTLSLEIGGTTPGTQYDRLVLSQTPALGGTVNVALINGFIPTEGHTFDVITWPSTPGTTFETENLPTWPPNGRLESSYTPTAYRLVAIGPDADLRVTQSVSGPVYSGDNVSFTITVTNDGPDPAASVVLTNNFSGPATFVSAPGCTGTGPVTCNLGTLNSGASATIVLTLDTTGTGTVTNVASVATSTLDPDTADNTHTAAVNVGAQADLGVSIGEAADPVQDGDNVQYTVTVANAGPSTASGITVNLSLTGGQIQSVSGGSFTCSGTGATRTCTMASLAPGNAAITVVAKAGTSSPMTLTASVTSSTHDPVTANNSSSESTAIQCTDAAPVSMEPQSGATKVPVSGNLTWNTTADASYTVYLGPIGSGCSMPFGSASGGSIAYALAPNTTYEWRVEASRGSCPITSSACATFTTGNSCATAPALIAPTGGATAGSPVSFQWTAVPGATQYEVFVSSSGAAPVSVGTSTTISLTADLTLNGTTTWYVVAAVEGCGNVQSAPGSFTVCNVPAAPLARVVGLATSGQTYQVEWDAVPNAVRYEVDEASNENFDGATTTSVTATQLTFTKNVTSATPLFYRVRAFSACTQTPSGNSPTARIIIIPLPPKETKSPNFNVPVGSRQIVVHEVFVPGQPNENLLFTATTDREWLTVSPSQGVIPPQGTTLQVKADPADLPNGTFTATVIVTITGSTSGNVGAHATSTTSTPVSISIVTPVTPVSSKPQASQHALVIPTVGHLGGLDSHWQSDVRLTNAGFQKVRYQLTFTPAAGSSAGVKQTTLTVDAGSTVALDDILRNWYGVGATGDGANGSLEILPLDNPEVTSLSTVASSRTYNVTANGTLGQFVPAIPLKGFVGRAASGALPQILSLQQIAQTSAYRTNVGVVEATGKSATAVLSVFNTSGSKVLEVPVNLAGGEQKQLNAFLPQNGIPTLADGRIEVRVIGGDGKVTAYASVVDNATLDPLLVSGVTIGSERGSRYVLPGVADLETGVAKWRTDMRIFNAGTAQQAATLRFFPLGGGEPRTANITLGAGEVRTLDDVVKTLFDTANVGGAVHVDTAAPSTLIVTGRTYNRTETGTFGQFINAVTPERATARNGRTLHILQVEDSTRYRTNIGVAEVSGRAATIELQVHLPDSKNTPTLRVPLAANEFRQFSLLRSLALGNVYNARVTVRVVDGDGRVTAYGSVIDELTQDPTYVPAQ